eukprot:TRINITY_DN792_c0_g1_i8.p1 TRINITY_DN792_c0_g1~~TRINITY_DN792_c0_g1_i8.p1  ORF type:complete len:516 (+),score=73.15 TRINITY_DN792_c0_g1_i8:56-1603(+)
MSTSPVMQVSIPGQPGPREEQRPTNSHSPSPEVPVVKDVVDAFRSNGARRQTLSRSVSPVAAKNASVGAKNASAAASVNHDGEEIAVSTKLVDRLRSRASVLFSGKRAKQRDELTRELKEKEQKRNARKSSSVQDDIEFAVYDFDKEKIEAHEKLKDIRDPMIVGKKPGWASVRWLNIDGFNAEVVQALGDSYNLHQLVMSDMIELNGRPKLDFYEEDGNIFIISKMISIEDELDTDIDEEIIYFYFNSTSGTLITFQEGRPGDVWEDVRKRLFRQTSKIRQSGADYLLFCLLDAILETCYPIVEMFGGRMEDLEFKLLKNATPQLNEQVYYVDDIPLFPSPIPHFSLLGLPLTDLLADRTSYFIYITISSPIHLQSAHSKLSKGIVNRRTNPNESTLETAALFFFFHTTNSLFSVNIFEAVFFFPLPCFLPYFIIRSTISSASCCSFAAVFGLCVTLYCRLLVMICQVTLSGKRQSTFSAASTTVFSRSTTWWRHTLSWLLVLELFTVTSKHKK